MNLVYNIKDKPKFGQVLLFALQQLLAIMAATIAVPSIVGNGMSQTAALFGAGVGTLVYLLCTKFRSPVFLGSSFAFLGSMFAAFAGAVSSVELGYLGLIIGACFAGLVYVVLAIIVKIAGVKWIDKIMPAVVIGPTVAIIGLSLAGNAIGDLMSSSVEGGSTYVALICGLVTLAVTMLCSVFGKKMLKMIPFVIGILAGYLVATCFTLIGNAKTFGMVDNFFDLSAQPKITVKVQFAGNEYDIDQITKNVAKAYKGSVKGAVKSVEIYIKPEDGAVYYVVDSENTGKVDL